MTGPIAVEMASSGGASASAVRFRTGDRDVLRHHLAERHVRGDHQQQRDHQRDRVQPCLRDADGMENRLQQGRDGRLAERTEQHPAERDAQLRAGHHQRHVLHRLERGAGPRTAHRHAARSPSGGRRSARIPRRRRTRWRPAAGRPAAATASSRSSPIVPTPGRLAVVSLATVHADRRHQHRLYPPPILAVHRQPNGDSARQVILLVSDRDPPNTVKSCANANT